VKKIILIIVVCALTLCFWSATNAKPAITVDLKITSPTYWISEGQHVAKFEVTMQNIPQEDNLLVTIRGQALHSFVMPCIDWVDMTYPLSEKRLAEFYDKEFNNPTSYKDIVKTIVPGNGKFENGKVYLAEIYLDPYLEYVFQVVAIEAETKQEYVSCKKAIATNLLDLPRKPKLYAQLNKATANSLETEAFLGGIKLSDFADKDKTIFIAQEIREVFNKDIDTQVSYLLEKIVLLADEDTKPAPHYKPQTIVFKVSNLKNKTDYNITISAKMPDGQVQLLSKNITTP